MYEANSSAEELTYSDNVTSDEEEELNEREVREAHRHIGGYSVRNPEDEDIKELAISVLAEINSREESEESYILMLLKVLNASFFRSYILRVLVGQSTCPKTVLESSSISEVISQKKLEEQLNGSRQIFAINVSKGNSAAPVIKLHSYKDVSGFEDAIGKRHRLSDGNFIPKLGLRCLPTWSQDSANRAIKGALSVGYRLFDVSHYSADEQVIGNALKKYLPRFNLMRSDVFITVKVNIVRPKTTDMPFTTDGSQNQTKSVRSIIIDEMQKCCLDEFFGYVDLLLLHYPKDFLRAEDKDLDNSADRLDAYITLEDLRAKLLVRSIGVANFEPSHITELLTSGRLPPTVNQCEMHPHLVRTHLSDFCRRNNIFLQAHSILQWEKLDPTISLQTDRCCINSEETIFRKIANKYHLTPSQLSLVFLLQLGEHIGVLPCSREIRRLQKYALAAAKLDDENLILDQIDFNKILELNLGIERGCYTKCQGWNVL